MTVTARVGAFGPPSAAARNTRAPCPRFSLRDRIALLEWHGRAPGFLARVLLQQPEPGDPPEAGEFALLYRTGDAWAAWGLAPAGQAFELWRMASGRTLGRFASVAAALAFIAAGAEP